MRASVSKRLASCLVCVSCALLASAAVSAGEPPKKKEPKPKSKIADPFPDPYGKSRPQFLDLLKHAAGYAGAYQGWTKSGKAMKLSTEPSFYILNHVREDARVYALVEAGMQKEAEGQYRDALKIYQTLFDKFLSKDSDILYRISKYGIFVPASQYVQRRILQFPKEDLQFYRTMYDARAREAYEQARRQYSLIGLTDVVNSMLATSYGDNALLDLGNAALDSGHYLEALEYFTTIRDFFPDSDCRTRELTLKIAYCRKVLGNKPAKGGSNNKSALSPEALAGLEKILAGAKHKPKAFHAQLASPPHITSDDYTLLPPTKDPMGLQDPVWKFRLPGSRNDWFVFSQPTITTNSVIYKHKNIVYARSLLNGELRWMNDLGGRVVWQSTHQRKFPMEGVLVQDGLVFTNMYKVGPSLVAYDEVTGQLKWAYGPMAASTREETRMRFESTPAGGPRAIFATYILDNIEGETHTDSEYGVMAFDSTTGRVRWRQRICRLNPGKFAGGFAARHRNRIRSFSSPPLYHEGTVYASTNAGAIAALDARSGRIKWLMKYPYYPGIHDATRQFGKTSRPYYNGVRPYWPFLWFNQRPLMIGERLYVMPVDTRMFMCIDRRSGRVLWCKTKGVNTWDFKKKSRVIHRIEGGGMTHFLGALSTGELVFVYRSRGGAVQLVDPKNGHTLWMSGDLLKRDPQPVMNYSPHIKPWAGIGANGRWYSTAARPFLSQDGTLTVPSYALINTGSYGLTYGYGFSLCHLDLKARKILDKRRYYSGEILAMADYYIHKLVPKALEGHKKLPHKDKKIKEIIRQQELIIKDTVPVNKYGPFRPFSRLTAYRNGIRFELRFGTREISMLYDRAAARKVLASQKGPAADFARAELALADSRLEEASKKLKTCLKTISSEDLDFRAQVNQQLYRVHQRLVRSGIRSADLDKELANCLGMFRTVSTLAEEIQTLFAIAEAYERKGDLPAAARSLRQVVDRYGHYEYPVASISSLGSDALLKSSNGVIDKGGNFVKAMLYNKELAAAMALTRKSLPLYLSTVSPLEKQLTVRAGEYAASKLLDLVRKSPEFAKAFGETGSKVLNAAAPEEQFYRVRQFAGTPIAQTVLNRLLDETDKNKDDGARKRLWALADTARVLGLKLPAAFAKRLTAPPPPPVPTAIAVPVQERDHEFPGDAGAARLLLERRDGLRVHPDLFFVGARVKKRLDNKFEVECIELKSGKAKWKTENIRLRGLGQEPGFHEAFVLEDRVIVHGLYDVIALGLKDGKKLWHFRTPFDFEIRHSVLSGDLLVLSGKAETLALYLNTSNGNGEVAWQVPEQGDLYALPYFHKDRLVSVRKLPFSVTVRYRATGKLIGRLALPDLSLHEAHPLIKEGPRTVPVAHEGSQLVVTDGWYYIALDIETLSVRWKRLIDQNDVTRQPAMRLFLGGDYLAVLKENYDQKVIYMLSSKTGATLWYTDPKNARSPQPMYSMLIQDGKAWGIGVHPGQGFYFVGRDAKSGKRLFQTKCEGYQSKPTVKLLPARYGDYGAITVMDRQNFELKLMDLKKGKVVHTIRQKGVGPFGTHGRVSQLVQNGKMLLLCKDKLKY